MTQERTFDPDKPDDNTVRTPKPDADAPESKPTAAPSEGGKPADREALGGNDEASDLRRTGDTQGAERS